MSIAETINPPKEHITTARNMVDTIFKFPPDEQLEMVTEIKNRLIKRLEVRVDELKKV